MLAAVVLTRGGCDDEVDRPLPLPEGSITVQVAPLNLDGLTDATYTLTVENEGGDTVWTRTVNSAQFGDGLGALAYVGSCDPTSNPNTVSLVLESLTDPSGVLTAPEDFANPAPASNPLTESVDCIPQGDVPVSFTLTVARAARQGFFDVAVEFQDIFCSAKLDCLGEGSDPLDLLHDPLTGEREQTAVMGFACTAGPGQDTYLWMDSIQINCDNNLTYSVNPAGGPGNLNPPYPGPTPNTTDLVFQASVFRGVEELAGATAFNKAFWNIAIGLNEDAFPTHGTCVLDAAASASDGAFVLGLTPDGTRWPVIDWNVTLIEAGAVSCSRHELGGGNGVTVSYEENHRFLVSYRAETKETEIQIGNPDATTQVFCDDQALPLGGQTECTIIPHQDGIAVLADAESFTLLPSAGTVSALNPSAGLSTIFTFTYTAPNSAQLVTVGTGVGAEVEILILDTPDATSTISCADPSIETSTQTLCTIVPKKAGVTIYASSDSFTPSAAPDGTTGPIAEEFGDALTFTYTAGATTGDMAIGTGLGGANATVLVYTTPDNTSTVTCVDATLAPGGTTNCTITPRKAGQPVYASASDYNIVVTPDGAASAPTPAIGNSFGFIFQAPATVGVKTINVGFGVFTTVEVVSEFNPTNPPTAPTITFAAGQDQQIQLSWDPPADTGGSPNIVYRAVCTSTNMAHSEEIITTNLTGIVPNLQNGTPYTCVVYASNEAGEGPPSDPTDIITPEGFDQPAGLVSAAPVALYNAGTYDDGSGGLIGTISAGPAVFHGAAYDSGLGAPSTGAIAAPPTSTYNSGTYDDAGQWTVQDTGVIASLPAVISAAVFDSGFGDADSGAIVSAPTALYNSGTYDDAGQWTVEYTGTIASHPAVIAGSTFDSGLGDADSGAIVSSPTAVYNSGTYDDAGQWTVEYTGVVTSLPAVFGGAAFDSGLGDQTSGSIVAHSVATYNAGTYDDAGLVGGQRVGTIASAPAVFAGAVYDSGLGDRASGSVVAYSRTTVGRPYIFSVTPTVFSVADGSELLTFDGIGFNTVTTVALYDPTETLNTTITTGTPTIVSDTEMTVVITVSGSPPTGQWTASVDNGSGFASPSAPPGTNVAYDNTFNVTP